MIVEALVESLAIKFFLENLYYNLQWVNTLNSFILGRLKVLNSSIYIYRQVTIIVEAYNISQTYNLIKDIIIFIILIKEEVYTL